MGAQQRTSPLKFSKLISKVYKWSEKSEIRNISPPTHKYFHIYTKFEKNCSKICGAIYAKIFPKAYFLPPPILLTPLCCYSLGMKIFFSSIGQKQFSQYQTHFEPSFTRQKMCKVHEGIKFTKNSVVSAKSFLELLFQQNML